ncbi:MAG: hypothetical protein IE922_07620 [Sphingomonadales bacterium]|nr:hypothetical protein [Sphingomonadales bacterium]
MSYSEWPVELPKPERATWQRQRQDGRWRRQGDAGPPMFRRRISAVANLVSLSVVLDRNGKAVFDTFFDETTQGGSTLFWMPDPTTDGWPLLASDGSQLLTAEGAPLLLSARWLCSFGAEMPTETVIGKEFRISFSVVVMP